MGSDYDSSSNSSILEELEFKKSESQNSDPEISSFSEVAPSILSVKNSSDLSKDNEIVNIIEFFVIVMFFYFLGETTKEKN